MEIVGEIEFMNKTLPVYGTLEEPLFRDSDVAKIMDYSTTDVWGILLMYGDANKSRHFLRKEEIILLIDEQDLYSILLQSRRPIANIWREVLLSDIANSRKINNTNIVEKFQSWEKLAEPIRNKEMDQITLF